MPPKKAARLVTADRDFANGQTAKWSFRADSPFLTIKYQPYSDEDSARIEAAFRAKAPSVSLPSGYVVEFDKMLQFKIGNRSKQRKVTRNVVTPDVIVVDGDDGDGAPPAKVHRTELTRKLSDTTVGDRSSGGEDSASTPRVVISRSVSDQVARNSTMAEVQSPPGSAGPAQAPLARPTGGLIAVIGEELLSVEIAAGHDPRASGPGIVKSNPHTGGKRPAGAAKMPARSVAAILTRVLTQCPPINRSSLDVAAKKMHPQTRRWLQEIGRPVTQKNMTITLPAPITELSKKSPVHLSDAATVPATDLASLAAAATFSYMDGPLPEPLLVGEYGKLDQQHYRDARRLMISGPVLVLHDNDYNPIATPPTVVACSTPGINFAYSKEDLSDYTASIDNEPRTLDRGRALGHMIKVWTHVLVVMDEVYRVQFPVLCAIGCGAFRGKFGAQVPRLWATALHYVLSTRSFNHVHAVFMSAPTFGDTNNYSPFTVTLNACNATTPMKVPVIVTEDMSMVTIAAILAEAGYTAGILNPSDVEAMRRGWIGMYWDGGHIAVEEVLAMQTSLLVQHVGVNPKLYTDPLRRLAVSV
jgi:hypothetical protein